VKLPRLPSGYGDPVPLGQGAWGEVWRVRQEALEREIALKILPGTRNPEEARRQAALDDSAFPAVYDAFHWHGRTFVAMEWLQGVSLSEQLQTGALSQNAAAWLGGRLSQALTRLHDNGLAHGDLKPANIVVQPDGEVRLLDLGFSQELIPGGAHCGTPAYLPPEALRQEARPQDRDLWAMALVLTESLLGRRPATPEDADRSLASLALPPWWAELLRRGLARDPGERWSDAQEWSRHFEAAADASSARRELSELVEPAFRRKLSRACLEAGQEHLRRGQAQVAFRLVSEALEWDPDHWPAMETLARIDLGKPRRRRLPWLLGAVVVATAGLAGFFAGRRGASPAPVRQATAVPLAPELLGSNRHGGGTSLDGPDFSEGTAPSLPAALLLPEACRCSVSVDGKVVAVGPSGRYPMEAGHHMVQLRRHGNLVWQGRVKATAYQIVAIQVESERTK